MASSAMKVTRAEYEPLKVNMLVLLSQDLPSPFVVVRLAETPLPKRHGV